MGHRKLFANDMGQLVYCTIILARPKQMVNVWIGLLGVLVAMPAWGHATGENYVWLNAQATHLEGRFAIRLDDLRNKLHVDLATDYDLASQQVNETSATVQQYIQRHFAIIANGQKLPITFTKTELFKADKLGHFAQYHYRTPDGEIPDQLTIRNDLLFEDDPFHRSLLLIEYDDRTGQKYGGEFTAMVFSPSNHEQKLDFTDIRGLLPIRDFVWQGALHIWIGIDHILFLVALLLPAVLVRRDSTWEPVGDFRSALWHILKVVTVFTLAHSITLSLAALEIVQLPSRLVESTIALSIILVALNNIFPLFRKGILLIVFLFGLFHGLGFATVMGQLPFRMTDLVSVLVAFNVGVEIGQIVVVAGIFLVILWLCKRKFYPTAVPVYGSAVLCVVAGYWFIQRALGLG
jgi:hypothetical protein